jgi:hypothetical protein
MGVLLQIIDELYLSRVLQQAARGHSRQVIPERGPVVEQSFGVP